MPFFLPPPLAALVLILLAFALASLRLAFRQAGAGAMASGVRGPPWFMPAALAALIAFRAVQVFRV